MRVLVVVSLVIGANPARLAASPTMIRLGYSDCVACHLSPQGGGLLTAYGKGIDEAQSLRGREVQPVDVDTRRLLFDVRFILAAQLEQSLARSRSDSSSTFRLLTRGSLKASQRNRVTYAVSLESPVLITASPSATIGPANLVVSKALWEYRPTDHVELAVGRDEMPSGIGLPDPQKFIRTASDAGDTTYPTQVKVFWWTRRLQLTPYLFGPGGDEPRAARQYGAGMVGGIDVWKQHAIVGMSTRVSNASTFSRRSVGAFARLGFGRWGILAEHDLTSRATGDLVPVNARYLVGHTELFVALKEWLVTSIAAEEMAIEGATRTRTYRIAPSVQARLSSNLTVIVNTREVFTGPSTGRARTFAVQLALKSVQ